MTLTIKQIKGKLLSGDFTSKEIQDWQLDSRSGVRKIVTKYLKDQQKKQIAWEKHLQRTKIEKKLYNDPNVTYIGGVDEVGRGPLAGPLVTAAVILPRDLDISELIGVNDSKTLTSVQRMEFAQRIKDIAIDYYIDVVEPSIIDQVNIYQATEDSMQRSLHHLKVSPDFVLIDAMPLDDLKLPHQSIIKGDQQSLSIAAASILAKVHRDQIMIEYSQQYPEYEFEYNMGYGTRHHISALKQYGYTPIHRRSFAPIKNMTKKYTKH